MKHTKTTNREKTARAGGGFSFIEVLVASSLMVVLLVPLFLLFSQGIRTTQVSIEEMLANLYAQEIVDQIAVMPYSRGLWALQDHPPINPAPLFPNWASVSRAELHLPKPEGTGAIRLETNGFTLTGWPYPEDLSDPDLSSYQRIYLSALPENFVSKVKVHRAILSLSRTLLDVDLVEIEARVEWKDRFLGSREQARSVELRTLVANPFFSPVGF